MCILIDIYGFLYGTVVLRYPLDRDDMSSYLWKVRSDFGIPIPAMLTTVLRRSSKRLP